MADAFDELIAGIHGYSDSASYHAAHRAVLARLDDFDAPPPIEDEQGYRRADEVRRMLSSLSCYTFNNTLPENDRAWALESAWAAAVAKYNRRLLIRNVDAKRIARYLVWNYRLVAADHQLYVVGLERAVGDNLFTVDGRGRHYRKYPRTIGRQALEVQHALPWSGAQAQAFLASVPELDPTWYPTAIGDRKHCARPSAFTQAAKRALLDLLAKVTAQMLESAVSIPQPFSSPRSQPVQLELAVA